MKRSVVPSPIAAPEVTKFMKKLAECSVCRRVPRHGVMLLCRDGHNVCVACKNKLEDNKQCAFNDPSTPSKAVATIVGKKMPFEFPCKYSEADDGGHSECTFEATVDELKRCESRSVPCPLEFCCKFVSANLVVDHLVKEHGATARTRGAYDVDSSKGTIRSGPFKLVMWAN
jgi:hypothetical protein